VNVWLVCNAPVSRTAGAPGRKYRLGQVLTARGHRVSTFGHEVMSSRWGRLAKHLFAFEVNRRLRRGEPPELIDASGAEAWRVLRRPRGSRPAVVVRSHGIEHRFHEAYCRELREKYPREVVVPRLGVTHRLLRLRLVESCVRRCDHLVCLSGQERDYVLARGWRGADGISVVNNGVDDEFFVDREYFKGPGEQVLFVNSWIFMKGIRYFARAMSRLLGDREGLRLSLVGTGATPPETIMRSFPEEVRPRIRLVPGLPHEKLVEEYAGHEVFVTPTLMESFGNVLAEAMAAGCACVATPFGAAAELGRDGDNMLVARPADPDSLAACIARLLDSPEDRERLGRAARATAERLRWSEIAAQTEDVYRRALEKHRGGTLE
jgi:glycosyltransferase involved in cell wall biosynthesis